MIVDDLDFVSIAAPPHETDAPALVDTNTVLTGPVPRQLLQSVAWRKAEVSQALSVVEHAKLPVGQLLEVGWEARRPFSGEDAGGLGIPDRLDHKESI